MKASALSGAAVSYAAVCTPARRSPLLAVQLKSGSASVAARCSITSSARSSSGGVEDDERIARADEQLEVLDDVGGRHGAQFPTRRPIRLAPTPEDRRQGRAGAGQPLHHVEGEALVLRARQLEAEGERAPAASPAR